jgi:hypothetical protein
MDAIRQIIKVKNNTFNAVLPKDFTAKTVEVIIIPTDDAIGIPEAHKAIVRKRILELQPDVDAHEMLTALEKDFIEKL